MERTKTRTKYRIFQETGLQESTVSIELQHDKGYLNINAVLPGGERILLAYFVPDGGLYTAILSEEERAKLPALKFDGESLKVN